MLWEACEETDTTVSMHIGSSSTMPTTAPDAPLATSMSLNAQNAQGSLCDWVFSGTLERFPALKIAYAESQVGWMPFQLERMDSVWHDGVGGVELPDAAQRARARAASAAASSTTCTGSAAATRSASSTILFETDYPHADGTFPHSRKVAHRLFAPPGMDADECSGVPAGQRHHVLRPRPLRHHALRPSAGRFAVELRRDLRFGCYAAETDRP